MKQLILTKIIEYTDVTMTQTVGQSCIITLGSSETLLLSQSISMVHVTGSMGWSLEI